MNTLNGTTLNRRAFLRRTASIVGGGAALALLAACGDAAPAASSTTATQASTAQTTGAMAATSGSTAGVSATTSGPVATMSVAATGKQTTVTFWSALLGSKEHARSALTAAFEAANPTVKINHQGFMDVDQLNEKLLAAFASGSVPDLVSNHFYYATNYADAGQLEPLDALMQRDGPKLETLDQALLKTGIYNGKTYSLPLYGTSRALLYNRTQVMKAGLEPDKSPQTWDELRQWSTKMTQRDGATLKVSGFYNDTQNEAARDLFTMLLWSAGGDFLSADNKKATFNSPQGVKALQFWMDLIQKDKVNDVGFGQGQAGAMAPFNAGNAAMVLGGNFTSYLARQAKVDVGIGLFPKADGGGLVAMADPFSLFIPSKAKNKDMAWQFVRFALTPEQQVAFSADSTNLPAITAAQSDAKITGNKDLAPFVEALKSAKQLPLITSYLEMWTSLSAEVQQALYGKKSAQQALDDAASKVNGILAK